MRLRLSRSQARVPQRALSFGRELEPLTAADIERVSKFEDRGHHIAKMWNYYLGEGRKAGVIPGDWAVEL